MSFSRKKIEIVDPSKTNQKQMAEMSLSQMEEEGKLVRQLSDKELRRNSRKIDLEIRKHKSEKDDEEGNPRVLILGTSDSGND